MTFDKLNRRTHLYLGLFLLPWLMIYGVSSFIIIHEAPFKSIKPPPNQILFEKPYQRPVTEKDDKADLRAVAQEILKDCNLEGAFWVNKPDANTLHIERFSFRDSISLTYAIKEQKITAEHRSMPWPQVAVRMHFRGGYDQPDFGNKVWGFLVDLACVAIILWVCSGLIMWWRMPRLRAWGGIAVAAGVLSFALLLWRL
jgi:hypothetical protein